MPTIRLPVERSWDVHQDRDNLYVELDLEELREFISQVARETVIEMQHNRE